MLKRIRILITELLVACIVVVVGVLFWASYYVDTEEFQDGLLKVAEAAVGAPVKITGGLDIALYPSLSLHIKGLMISGPPEFGDTPLVEVESVRVGARLLPLLDDHLDFKTIMVDGLTFNMIRSSEGQYNWSQTFERQLRLLDNQGSGGGGIEEISLNGIEITGATVNYTDQADGDTVTLSGLELHIEDMSPENKVPFQVGSSFAWEKYGVEATFTLDGNLGINSNFNELFFSDTKIAASVGGSFLPGKAKPAQLTSSVNINLEGRTVSLENILFEFMGATGRGRLESGPLDKQLKASGAFAFEPFNPGQIVSFFSPSLDLSQVDGLKTARFHTGILITDTVASLTGLALQLDDQNFQGRIGLSDYSDPTIEFDLSGDRLDVDRYMPLFARENDDEPDTPLRWKDIPLDLFTAVKLNGMGTVDVLKVSGTEVTALKFSLNGLQHPFVIDTAGVAPGGQPVKSHTVLSITRDAADGVPVLGGALTMNTVVGRGLWVPEDLPVKIEADGRVNMELEVGPTKCLPDSNPAELLNSVSGSVVLVYDEGVGTYRDGEKSYSLDFTEAEVALNFEPAQVKDTDYGLATKISVHGQGGKDVHVFSFSSEGIIGLLGDKLQAFSDGMNVQASVGGSIFTDRSDRISVKTLLAFDSSKHWLDIREATVRTLETTIEGAMRLENLDKSITGAGRLEIPNANVRRIVYLLTDFGLRTDDVNALKAVRVNTTVSLDSKGFQLGNFDGELDGMYINGQIAGDWAHNPKLVFALKAGKFDLDRYLPPSEPALGRDADAPYEPVELPLAFFRWLNLKGTVEFEEFKLIRTRTQKVKGIIEAEKGNIHVSNVTGKAYKGRLTADWKGLIREKDLTTDLVLRVKGMQAGPFMVDVAKRDYFQGDTDIAFELSSVGLTDFDIVKNLEGTINIDIGDGSYKFTGYDLKPSTDPATQKRNEEIAKRRTPFRKAYSVLPVSQGVLNVDTLRVEAPVLESSGRGWINLPEYLIDLSIQNDFVAVPSITVRIVGDLGSPDVKVPKDKIVSDTVINILSLPIKSFDLVRDIFK